MTHMAALSPQTVHEELLARLPGFALDPADPPTCRGGHVVGPETLPTVGSA